MKPLSDQDIVKFWSRVNRDGPTLRPELGNCWVWIAGKHRQGYGHLRVCGHMGLAHRISWMIHYGEYPELDILHKCDNPPCIRLDHLFEGTQLDNMKDCAAKGRISHGYRPPKTHCIHGHEYTKENLRFVTRKNGRLNRMCKACDNESHRRRYRNNKAA